MATTIKVNGQTITIGNKPVVAQAVESYDFEDVYAKAVESAFMVDIMSKALNSVESTFAMSTEAKGNFKKNMAKFGESVKKVWEKIVAFFQNIARSIQAFFMGTGLRLRAKALLAKLEKNKGKFAKNWEKTTIKVSAFARLEKIYEKIDKLSTAAKDVTSKVTENSDESADDKIAAATEAIIAAMEKEAAAKPAKDMTVGEAAKKYGISESSIKTDLTNIANNSSAAIKKALEWKSVCNKAAAEANKIGKKDDKATKKGKRAAYRAAVKASNLGVKSLIEEINVTLKIGAAMINGGAKPAVAKK